MPFIGSGTLLSRRHSDLNLSDLDDNKDGGHLIAREKVHFPGLWHSGHRKMSRRRSSASPSNGKFSVSNTSVRGCKFHSDMFPKPNLHTDRLRASLLFVNHMVNIALPSAILRTSDKHQGTQMVTVPKWTLVPIQTSRVWPQFSGSGLPAV